MRALLRYSILIYLTNSHYLLPLVCILVYCGFLYTLIPLGISECFAVSVTILFAVSLLDGFFSYKVWNHDMRAILVLKTGSAVKYYGSNEILLALLAVVYAVMIFLYPGIVFGSAAAGEAGHLSAYELIALLALHLFVALCGYEIGSLFQPDMMGRRIPVALLFSGTILGIFLRNELSMVPIIKYVFWIFPPIAKVLQLLHTEETFCSAEIRHIVGHLGLYTLLLLAGKWFLLSRRKWAVYE